MLSCFRRRGHHDKLLSELYYPDAARAWDVVCQQFINDCFSRVDGAYNAIPYLDANSCPCSPSTVILVRERSFSEWLMRKDRISIMAGQFTDFYPPRLLGRQAVPATEKPEYSPTTNLRREYRTRDGMTRVIVVVHGVEVTSLASGPDRKSTMLDLDNFDATGFHSDLFYMVTSTVSVDKIRVRVKMGSARWEALHINALTPIAYKAVKISMNEETRTISHTKCFKKTCPLAIRKRSYYELLLNNLTPNQMRFGGAVGDKELIANEDGVTRRVLRQIYRTLRHEDDDDDEPQPPAFRLAPYNPNLRPNSQEARQDNDLDEPPPRSQSA